MRFRWWMFSQAVMLASFSLFFIYLHITGDITKYVNPKYVWVSQLAAILFVVLLLVQLFRIWEQNPHDHHCHDGCEHSHSISSMRANAVSTCILLFPLLAGFAFPPVILDASLAQKKGVIQLPVEGSERQPNSPAANRQSGEGTGGHHLSEKEYNEKMDWLKTAPVIEMDNELFAPYYEEIQTHPERYDGRKIKLTGFVYKEDGLKPHQLILSRFLITHCLADASVIGFLVEFSEAGQYKQDMWLEIEGRLQIVRSHGAAVPVIAAERWKVVSPPPHPYVYPVSIQIL
ncbi:TIGR03943 family protein [Geobacillus sp. C56-T2]|uniref:TIGR03943 family putative permease subunit n=1 Tax=Geobacillus sp. C56-T2 TaxID=600773 RepID=UPI0011A77AB5|nr:TIGR03943 family protein [Geobacillus sp. C56-T2]NNV07233.1 TIGR03943 family protein [Geobacillus sp. MMMUD3]TWG30503.1 putative membrane protein [Geobacillus sp. C56-T2]